MDAVAEPLDEVFQALSNPTRRAVLERLGRGPASVTELGEPFDMALPSFLQHLQVLEHSGLVTSSKRGRVRTVRLARERMDQAGAWIERQRALWNARLDRLDDYLQSMEDER